MSTEIQEAARELESGDILLVTYAGHGMKFDIPQKDKPYTVAWCLYDGPMLDAELRTYWSGFKKGVRIVVLSDSCHSGTITREASADVTDRGLTDDEQACDHLSFSIPLVVSSYHCCLGECERRSTSP